MDIATLAAEGDLNLASSWANLAEASGGAQLDLGPALLTCQHLPVAFFNGAFVRRRGDDPEALVAASIEFFRYHGVPWLLWVREGVWPEVLAAGLAAGLTDSGGPPGMVLPALGIIPPPPEGLVIDMVADLADLADHAALVREAFDLPPSVTDRILSPAVLDLVDMSMVVGRCGGEPVSTAALCVAGSTAGIYNVATAASQRGKGFGEALTWAAIAEGVRRGCTHSVLQASRSGAPVYRRMGFVDVGLYHQLAGPPA